MKLNILLVLALVPSFVYASTEYTNQAEFLKNVPQLTTGVKIVSFSHQESSKSLRDLTDSNNRQMKINGYIESSTPNAKTLMSVKETIPPSKVAAYHLDTYDTGLKKNITDIKLAFNYTGVSDESKRIGFAPAGTYIKAGWTGVREFFEDKDLGICSITLFHLQSSNMSIKINADVVSYVVNNLPTTYEAEGSNKSGFIYTLSWVDPTFSKDLECAKMTFDKGMKKKLVDLANNIEKI